MATWVELYSPDGSHEDVSVDGWTEALAVARNRGWTPAGAFVAGWGPYWPGDYLPQHGCSPFIEEGDAAALARALEASLAAGDFDDANMPEKRSISNICQRAAVLVELADNTSIFCHGCEPNGPTSFEHVSAAHKLPWGPNSTFDPFYAFREAHRDLTRCCGVYPRTRRLGLAQAICGHLACRPQDAALADPELLGAVEQTFFRGFWLPGRLEWAAHTFLRQAAERRAWSEDAVPLPLLVSPGPWWRAASILADANTALAAAGTEWLYRRAGATLPRPISPAPDVAQVTGLDAEQVQREIWGADRELWPTTHLGRKDPDWYNEDEVWRLIDDEGAVEGTVDDWEKLTGLPWEELLKITRT